MANNGNNKLTVQQQKAIAALLMQRDIKAAAKATGIGYRTLCRWMTVPDFRSRLVMAEGEAIDQATRRLIGLQDSAVDVLENLMKGTTAKDETKLRAAQMVLDHLLKLRDLRNLENRIAQLEQDVYSKEGSVE